MNKLFVCFSHTLTSDQISSLEAEFGITADNIIMVGNVNPTLATTCQNIDPFASFSDIEMIAAQVVAEACKIQATHIMCMGEPALATCVNMIAAGKQRHIVEFLKPFQTRMEDADGWFRVFSHIEEGWFTCIQSTTQRTSVEETLGDGTVKKSSIFKHAMWRVWWK